MANRIALAAFASLLLGPLAARLGVVSPIVGFGFFLGGGLLGLIAIVLGAIGWRRDPKAKRAVLLGAVALIVVIAPFAIGMSRGGPAINDISTVRVDAPTHSSLEWPEYSAELEATVAKAYPKVVPLTSTKSSTELFAVATKVADEMPGWTISLREPGLLVGHQETPLFRFRDDFVITARAFESGSRLEMRSKSQDGKSDFGVNAKRIETFMGRVAKQLSK